MKNRDHLYNSPSFMSGVARSIDLFGEYTAYSSGESAQQADATALYNDVKAIGQDFYSVLPSE